MDTIGRYKILEKLPSTGMATVFKAFDQEFDGEVFIKQFPSNSNWNLTARAHFEHEMRLLSLLENPGVLPIYEIAEYDGCLTIVTPFLSGGSLADKMTQGPLSLDESLLVFEKIVFCLEAVHELGISHQALKPANILFDEQGELFITDFGINKVEETTMPGVSTFHQIVSWPQYMSPEQLLSRKVNAQSDIYALGLILFEMLTGQSAFTSAARIDLAVMQVERPLPDIYRACPECPAGMDLFFQHCLAKDPEKRFGSLAEMLIALIAVYEGVPVPAHQPGIIRERLEPDHGNTALAGSTKPARLKPVFAVFILILTLSAAAYLAFPNLRSALLARLPDLPTGSISQGDAAAETLQPTTTLAPTITPFQTATTRSQVVEISLDNAPTATEQPPIDLPVASHTPAAQLTEEALMIGGADKIAFINANDVWMANLDGTGLERLTFDEVEKTDLRWSNDGRELIYRQDGRERTLEVFSAASTVEQPTRGFESGKWVYYSKDGKRKAIVVTESWNGRQVELIKVYDIYNYDQPKIIDHIPGDRFEMRGYSGANDAPVIMEFAWDGADLFALHGDVIRDGGDLVVYNLGTAKASVVNPIEGNCCYKDLGWSPDGQYLLFAYQDVRYDQAARLYYVPYGTLGTGQTYEPIDLPYYFFADLNARIYPALHPAVSGSPANTSTATAPAVEPTQDLNSDFGEADPGDAPVIGGVDKIAFLRENEIWIMNVDGSALERIHTVVGAAGDLQWSSDGNSIVYKAGGCYHAVSISSRESLSLGCYVSLGLSQDGESAAVSANLKFDDNLVRMRASSLPFSLIPFSRGGNFLNLETLGSCPIVEGESYQWGKDNQRIAAIVETNENGRSVQAIRVFDLGDCGDQPNLIDTFPSTRFSMQGYSGEAGDPTIVDFAWDGNQLFALNGDVQEGFGELIVYDMGSKKADILDPLKKICCYRDMRWSADSTYIFFSTQDLQNRLALYFVPLDQARTQANLVALPLPAGFWNGVDLRTHLFPALRFVNAEADSSPPPIQDADLTVGSANYELRTTLSHAAAVNAIDISADGAQLAAGAGSLLKIWDLSSYQSIHEFDFAVDKHTEAITGVAFSPDGLYLASSSVDETLRVWKLDYYVPRFNLGDHAKPVLALDYSFDGNYIASTASDGTVLIWRTSNGGVYRRLTGHEMPVYGVSFSPDGQKLVSVSADKTVRVWDVVLGEVEHTLVGHTAPVSSVAISPDGRLIASAAWDATVRIWDLQSGSLLATLKSSEAPVASVGFSPQGDLLIAGSENGLISIWETENFSLTRNITDQVSAIISLAFSPDGALLAASTDSGKVLLFYRIP